MSKALIIYKLFELYHKRSVGWSKLVKFRFEKSNLLTVLWERDHSAATNVIYFFSFWCKKFLSWPIVFLNEIRLYHKRSIESGESKSWEEQFSHYTLNSLTRYSQLKNPYCIGRNDVIFWFGLSLGQRLSGCSTFSCFNFLNILLVIA